ncbi:MAG: aldo/keto reductase [Opitutaceae bacterium]|jgi:aryl-alcohol dehydrogenase-like predicted oxidoreductase|nr:aldo/keto reductase [Opitutaceae bacterium]
MQYRPFGKQSFSVSEIGFGAWAIGGSWGAQRDDTSLAALHHALDLGCDFIDTAAGYGNGRSEKLIAQVLRERAASGKTGRVFVATKTPPAPGIWPPSPYCRADARYSENYLRENIAQRLANLGVSRLDLLQLHTWTRAWNRDPAPFKILRRLQREGLVGLVGVSTPEHDQNSVIDLMRGGWVDSVQVIYNLFEQEPAAGLLDVARECGVGVIVRVVFDEGVLTGKFTAGTQFAPDDFRAQYFAGDRLARAVARTGEIQKDLDDAGYTLPQAAIKFVLAHPAVTTVIPGIRNPAQAVANCAVSDLPAMPEELLLKLRRHNWRRAVWYGGK